VCRPGTTSRCAGDIIVEFAFRCGSVELFCDLGYCAAGIYQRGDEAADFRRQLVNLGLAWDALPAFPRLFDAWNKRAALDVVFACFTKCCHPNFAVYYFHFDSLNALQPAEIRAKPI